MRDVRAVLTDHLPGYRVDTVRPCGAGTDNVAYEVNGDLIVRFRRTDPAAVDREAKLLAVVAGISPLPVPEPVLVDPRRGVLAYRRLPGTPLLGLPTPDRPEALGAELGRFLAALHAVPPDRVAGLAATDDTPPGQWLAEAVATWPAVVAHVPVVHRSAVEAFLAAPPPATAQARVFSHCDLGIEHILVTEAAPDQAPADHVPADRTAPDRATSICGIIDWGDAAVGDPAYDMGLILRDLGPGAFDAALRAYGRTDAALRGRAAYYARCGLIEDLAYGLETGRRRYADKGLAAMTWLFEAAGR
jgi:aminoglycoside phosphotransferase (APT) family kinase protein